jgi:hypothetical protein
MRCSVVLPEHDAWNLASGPAKVLAGTLRLAGPADAGALLGRNVGLT